jgi:hypothetical protein
MTESLGFDSLFAQFTYKADLMLGAKILPSDRLSF